MAEERYNGWTNWETWLANLWIGNEYESYSYWKEAAEVNDTYDLSQMMKEHFEESIPEDCTGFFRDLINGELSSINWYEIAEQFKED